MPGAPGAHWCLVTQKRGPRNTGKAQGPKTRPRAPALPMVPGNRGGPPGLPKPTVERGKNPRYVYGKSSWSEPLEDDDCDELSLSDDDSFGESDSSSSIWTLSPQTSKIPASTVRVRHIECLDPKHKRHILPKSTDKSPLRDAANMACGAGIAMVPHANFPHHERAPSVTK